MEDLIRLIYVSSATHEMDKDELQLLLTQIRSKNKQRKITGMLLYIGGNFIQVLEGGRKEVEDVYQSIEVDNRNTNNIVMDKSEIAERVFPHWSMGFRHLTSKEKIEIAGYSDFIEHQYTPKELAKLDISIRLLYQFKESNN